VATARGDGSPWAPVDGLPGDRVLSLAVGPVTAGGLTYVTAAQGKQIVEQLHSKL
jgi:hypothetical protein